MDTESKKGAPRFLILIIGLVVGLLIAGGIALVKSGLSNKGAEPDVTTESTGILLSVTTPSPGDVTSESKVTVKGSTGKDTVVAVTSGGEDAIIETKAGRFSQEIGLTEGENEIGVYAFDPATGESAQTTVGILYLNEELAGNPVLVAASHEDVIEKNKERVEKLKDELSTKSADLKKSGSIYKRSHVFGTITAIADSTVTIETKRGDVKDVFTDDFTKFFSVGTGGKTTIALENLKVGDRVSAVGISADDTGGKAKFVVRIAKSASKRHAVLGKVKSVSGSTLTLTHLTQTDREFTVVVAADAAIKIKGTDGTASVSDIQKDDVIVAVGTVGKTGTITAKRIFVVPGKREGLQPKESTSSATPSANQ